MLGTQNIIEIAKDALAMPEARYAGTVATSGLKTALRNAEASRAAFADYRNLISQSLLAIERTLDTGAALDSCHRINDEHYSKVTSSGKAANFRATMLQLDAAHAEFLADISSHRALLARAGFRATA